MHIELVHERAIKHKCTFEGCHKGFPYKSLLERHEQSHLVCLYTYVVWNGMYETVYEKEEECLLANYSHFYELFREHEHHQNENEKKYKSKVSQI